MVRDAYLDAYDLAVIVSGDSDLTPAARLVREAGKKVHVRIPTLNLNSDADRRKANEYQSIAHSVKVLPYLTFINSQLPKVFTGKNGVRFQRPDSWRQAPTTALADYKKRRGL
jgi:hypothetical protein